GTSAYFRLSTRPIDQALAGVPDDAGRREERRRDVLGGGYLLRRAEGPPAVTLVGAGVVMPEVLDAADTLAGDGLACDVVCLTSADLVFRALRARQGFGDAPTGVLDAILPPNRAAPIVAVLDGHPHTLAFLGAVNTTPVATLGVADFGQVGDVGDLYRHFGIDAATITGAAWDLVDAAGG
ncbi:MAG TPA: pyruvate dehydrogenase, partial [Acidimicrobiales bacterium]|nr:pyruvate dehydrogenase [Acidimicrobiales bacterium]